jgi:hypothetical protein
LLPSYVDAATGKDSKKKGANGDNFIFVMSNEIDPVDISPPNRIKIISATRASLAGCLLIALTARVFFCSFCECAFITVAPLTYIKDAP